MSSKRLVSQHFSTENRRLTVRRNPAVTTSSTTILLVLSMVLDSRPSWETTMLTHIQIASAKPAEKPFKLHDDKGLHLLIRPNGSKLWRMRYRFLDKQKELHIGPWPQVGIAEARTRRDEAKASIAAGNDPAVEKSGRASQRNSRRPTPSRKWPRSGFSSASARGLLRSLWTRSGGCSPRLIL